METIFLICAIVGGTLLVCQFVLGLLGFGHHEVGGGHDFQADAPHDFGHDAGHDAAHAHDSDQAHDHDHSHAYTAWLTGVLTFRAIVAALTFFGLAGMAAITSGLEPQPQVSLLIASAAGLGALFLVAFVMRMLARLRSEGTVRIERAVGATGTVYLSIPGHRTGMGKVQLKLQNRIVEYQAITALDELPTGSLVVVVAVTGPGTVEVAAQPGSSSPNTERTTHAS
jgi:hypothetical protein